VTDGWGPIELDPILMPKVWGGRRLAETPAFEDLARSGGGPAGPAPIGEAWVVADLPEDVADGRSLIRRGPGAGLTLHELIRRHPDAVLGRAEAAEDGGFPLLVKWLDAAEDLSVQVHPTAAYAAAHPEARVKSEAWFIVAADPGARILRGFRPDPTTGDRRRSAADLRRAVSDGTIAEELESMPAVPGDCHVLPSGLCHALGGGILVLEVQTPSDTTFRLHDWGRSGRSLHIEPAIACLAGPDAPSDSPPVTRATATIHGPARITELAQTDAFTLQAISGGSGGRLDVSIPKMPCVLIGIAGATHLESGGGSTSLPAGGTLLLPAACGPVHADLAAGSQMLRAVPAARSGG
jgi:mannose-6-phosphate isomerase